MQKNNIRMIVQFPTEQAYQFAERIEKACYDLAVQFKNTTNTPPIVFLTSAADGRQTATLQFITNESDKTKEATFNGYHLRVAYDRFKEITNKDTNETDAMLNFFLKEVIDDYVEH